MAAPPLSSLPANTLAQQAHSPLRDTPTIIIHVRPLRTNSRPMGMAFQSRVATGDAHRPPLSGITQESVAAFGSSRGRPSPSLPGSGTSTAASAWAESNSSPPPRKQEVVPLAPEPRPQPIPLQFRAGSKGPALIHFLTKRCMFGQPFGRPDRPPAHGPAARPMPSSPDTYTALRPARRFGPQSRAFSRPPSRGRQPGPDLWPGP